jgi:hypothetical protein
MYQPPRQRLQQSDASQERHGTVAEQAHRRRAPWLPAGVISALMISGCATNGSVTDPLAALGNPFQRPTEAGFRAMAQASCASMTIGDTTVGALLGKDPSFDTMVTALYDGDISNDEFMNQLLLQHPSPDANIPAAGCIMDELERCFAETCKVMTPAERAKMDTANAAGAEEIETSVTIDPGEIPAEDQAQVEQMIEQAKEDGPQPLP